MVIEEVFPNPTVKQVIFQIRFPNLFFIEDKIGEFQMAILKEFPKSSLLYRRHFMLVDKGPRGKLEEVPDLSDEMVRKIWNFKSERNYELNVASDRLDITSEFHKTYNLGTGDKFRDIIKFVIDNFLPLIKIPVVSRVGLRYIDHCPLPSKDNDTFRSYYSSSFPIDRYSIADADEMFYRTVVKKGHYHLTYMESLQKIENEYKLILDFDGFANDVPSETCLTVTDDLHKIISEEYERTIKEPVLEYMRRKTSDVSKD